MSNSSSPRKVESLRHRRLRPDDFTGTVPEPQRYDNSEQERARLRDEANATIKKSSEGQGPRPLPPCPEDRLRQESRDKLIPFFNNFKRGLNPEDALAKGSAEEYARIWETSVWEEYGESVMLGEQSNYREAIEKWETDFGIWWDQWDDDGKDFFCAYCWLHFREEVDGMISDSTVRPEAEFEASRNEVIQGTDAPQPSDDSSEFDFEEFKGRFKNDLNDFFHKLNNHVPAGEYFDQWHMHVTEIDSCAENLADSVLENCSLAESENYDHKYDEAQYQENAAAIRGTLEQCWQQEKDSYLMWRTFLHNHNPARFPDPTKPRNQQTSVSAQQQENIGNASNPTDYASTPLQHDFSGPPPPLPSLPDNSPILHPAFPDDSPPSSRSPSPRTAFEKEAQISGLATSSQQQTIRNEPEADLINAQEAPRDDGKSVLASLQNQSSSNALPDPLNYDIDKREQDVQDYMGNGPALAHQQPSGYQIPGLTISTAGNEQNFQTVNHPAPLPTGAQTSQEFIPAPINVGNTAVEQPIQDKDKMDYENDGPPTPSSPPNQSSNFGPFPSQLNPNFGRPKQESESMDMDMDVTDARMEVSDSEHSGDDVRMSGVPEHSSSKPSGQTQDFDNKALLEALRSLQQRVEDLEQDLEQERAAYQQKRKEDSLNQQQREEEIQKILEAIKIDQQELEWNRNQLSGFKEELERSQQELKEAQQELGNGQQELQEQLSQMEKLKEMTESSNQAGGPESRPNLENYPNRLPEEQQRLYSEHLTREAVIRYNPTGQSLQFQHTYNQFTAQFDLGLVPNAKCISRDTEKHARMLKDFLFFCNRYESRPKPKGKDKAFRFMDLPQPLKDAIDLFVDELKWILRKKRWTSLDNVTKTHRVLTIIKKIIRSRSNIDFAQTIIQDVSSKRKELCVQEAHEKLNKCYNLIYQHLNLVNKLLMVMPGDSTITRGLHSLGQREDTQLLSQLNQAGEDFQWHV